jgi:hypothetical protein
LPLFIGPEFFVITAFAIIFLKKFLGRSRVGKQEGALFTGVNAVFFGHHFKELAIAARTVG